MESKWKRGWPPKIEEDDVFYLALFPCDCDIPHYSPAIVYWNHIKQRWFFYNYASDHYPDEVVETPEFHCLIENPESEQIMTTKPCSICGSIEYTSSYTTKDGRRICNLHKTNAQMTMETLLKACGLKMVLTENSEVDVENEDDC